MPTFQPVDYDPFAQQPGAPSTAPQGVRFEPVDYNPFEEPKSGNFNNATAGINSAIYSTVGAPVDAATWLTNKAVQGVNAVTGANLPQARTNLPGSSEWLAGVGEKVGVNDPSKVQATTFSEKMARALGTGVGSVLAPEAAIGLAGRAGGIGANMADAVAPYLGRSATLGDLGTNAAIGATAGVGGQLVSDQLPDEYKPLGSVVGGLAGGALGAGALAAGQSVAGIPRAVRDFRLSSPEAQETAAAGVLRDASERARAPETPSLQERLGEVLQPEIVPGSKPTTFQATGDMGLGTLERGVAAKNPEAFNQRRAEQNMARMESLQGIQPQGAPETVVQALRDNLASLDAISSQSVEGALGKAQGLTNKLGGDLPPEAYGAALREAERPGLEQATSAAQKAMGDLGGLQTPEVYGANMRAKLMENYRATKEQERALWNAIDPDGTINLPVTGTQQSARSMLEKMPKLAEPMAGKEAAIFADALRLPEVIPLRELTELRSRVSEAMREELFQNGQSRVYGRLTQLRGAIGSDIENAVANKAATEQRAVQAGQMSEADTMASAVNRMINDWRSRQAEAETGRNNAAGAGNTGATSASFVPPGFGGKGQARGRSGNPAGDQGVQGSGLFPDDLQPNFDEATAGRLKEATEFTKNRAQTFEASPVAEVMRREGQSGPFNLPETSVPGRVFQPGPKGFSNIQVYRKAVGDEAALTQLQDYAISSLRREAARPDGTLDPAAFQKWQAKYQDALRGLPGLVNRIGTAEKASQLMEAAKLLPDGLLDADIARRVFRPGPGGYESVTKFVNGVGNDRAKAILEDYAIHDLRRNATSPDGTLDPKKVAAWTQRNTDALRALPEVEAKLSDPVKASEALAEAAVKRKEQLDAFQQGAVARLLKVDDPADVANIVGGIFSRQDAVKEMSRLARETAANPAAREGLRKAIASFMTQRLKSFTEAATSGENLLKSDSFQRFVSQSAPALRQVFSPEEIGTMQAIAADLNRANRSITAVKLPGGSNTTQDLIAASRSGAGQSWLERALSSNVLSSAGAAAGSALSGGLGAAVGSSAGNRLGAAAQAMRAAGLEKVDDIIRDALLNPERARALLAKVPANPSRRAELSLAQKYARAAIGLPVSIYDTERNR